MKLRPRRLKRASAAVALVAALAFVLVAVTSIARTSDGRPCGDYWAADDIQTCNVDDIRRTANAFGLTALVAGGVAGVIAFVDRSYEP